ncbi:MAG TPA: GNAT family protein [Verrucomicrobiae bacterium]|nr:GNAT family protein [Verrucomicrobiae bacterium]
MAHAIWPLFNLRGRTLRLATDDDGVARARLAAAGIHHPEVMPFEIPWTDAPVTELERNALQWWWRLRAECRPDAWALAAAVFLDGEPVGVQDHMARHVSELGTVGTGSWLGRAHERRGIGREMRAAVLHLAFEGLGAVAATSAAFADNPASLAVSRALGYTPNGESWTLRRGAPARTVQLRLDRAQWLARPHPDIVIENLDGCRAMFGAPAPSRSG